MPRWSVLLNPLKKHEAEETNRSLEKLHAIKVRQLYRSSSRPFTFDSVS
jgi:acetyl-CoA carboxylase alpha subunit